MSQMTARPDPAPSRLKYRVERLWLTPLFRLALRVGLPMVATFAAATWWLSQEENLTMITDSYAEMRSQIEQRPEFMVNLMTIEGASDGVAEDIREILPLDFPMSSFDLDLDAMRETVVELDAVKTVRMFVRQGNVLQVDVIERVPAVVWRTDEGLELVDAEGVSIGPIYSRAERVDLPLIVGDGADQDIPTAIALMNAAAPLEDRMRGLVRVGERRWDVVLDRDQRIMLPEEGAVRALERAIAMDQAVDMLERDVVVVDLRIADRPTIRMTDNAVRELWRIRAIETGEPVE